MPTPTYIPLANVTLGTAASSVTFSSIPATFRDLVLVTNHTGSTAIEDVDLALNGDTGANYTRVVMLANASSVQSFANTNRSVSAIYGTKPQTLILNLMDYSATDKHKTLIYRNSNAQQSEVFASATRYANTAAITSLSLTARTGTFSTGSTFSLYGIAA